MARTLAPARGSAPRLADPRTLLDAPWRALAAAWRHRAPRVAMICALCALPLLGGGYMLLRHSSLTSVERVTIRGVHGPQATAIDQALRGAARGMSTLGVSTGSLMSAVHAFPAVTALHVHAGFPHSLRIVVVEAPAVAALSVHGVRTAVAADGTALGPALLSAALPTLNGWYEPPPGRRLHGRALLEALAAIGAAPKPLAHFVKSAYDSPQRGLTLAFGSGLLAYFGDGARPHAKWDSLARVLADPSSAGASYVDVRVPEHPAAGGFPGGVPPDASGEASEPGQTSQSAISALAATLSSGTGEELQGAKATEEAHEAGAGASAESEGSATSESEEATTSTEATGAEAKH